jgi:hypothetical protein
VSTPAGRGDVTFPVVIDQRRLDEDLGHSTAAAQGVATAAAQRLQRHGASRASLHPCQAEARDGTELPGCVKTYLPDVNGAWGMVFALRADNNGRVYLELLAFGQRHPTRQSTPSVYQVAAVRLRHL